MSGRRSVIINTMTVWVYTKCRSGKRLPSGETASLFLRLIYIADDNAAAFQLEGNKAVIWSWKGELGKYLVRLWLCLEINFPKRDLLQTALPGS